MVDSAKLHAKFQRVPQLVAQEAGDQLEKEAARLVATIRSLLLDYRDDIEVGWTFGDAPKGTLKIGTFRGKQFGKLAVTVFADGKNGINARWPEFGTAPRFTRAGAGRGQIIPTPFFFPGYRARRDAIQTNLRRAVKRGFQKASST